MATTLKQGTPALMPRCDGDPSLADPVTPKGHLNHTSMKGSEWLGTVWAASLLGTVAVAVTWRNASQRDCSHYNFSFLRGTLTDSPARWWPFKASPWASVSDVPWRHPSATVPIWRRPLASCSVLHKNMIHNSSPQSGVLSSHERKNVNHNNKKKGNTSHAFNTSLYSRKHFS